MSFYDAIRIGASGAADYEVERSLRFNTTDQTEVTNSSLGTSPTSRRISTVSVWTKRSDLSSGLITYGYSGGGGSQSNAGLRFVNSNTNLGIENAVNNSQAWQLVTTRVFRDFSAWYHIVVAIDTTQSTASDRVKVYINGVQETSFSTANYPSQNYDNLWLYSNARIGASDDNGSYYAGWNGYIAEYNAIDGQALTPASFGETDATTGQWMPKKYTGSYGTNGHYLNFSDNSGTTATTLGKDYSGNGKNFTPSNFSVAAGDGNDSKTDTPTLNKATLNPLTGFTYNATLSEGNLKMSGSSGFKEISTIAFAGTSKFYYEVVNTSRNGWQLVGIFVGQPNNPSNGLTNTAVWGFASTQATYFGGSYTSTSDVPSWTNNDVMGIKYENGSLKLYKNGTLQTATTSSVPTGDIVFAYIVNDNQSAAAFARFSSNDWTQDSAAGVDATWELSSANLPDPTIKLPDKHFDTLIWTGTGSSNAITGLNFQPDFLWAKSRSQGYHHTLIDSARGTNKQLWADRNNEEQTDTSFLTSFNSNGVTLGDNSSGTGATNTNGHTYVGWNWDAGETDGKTYTVTVVSDSGNKYRFDGFGTSAVTLDLAEGGTYIFNYPSAHPLKFSTTADGTHGGGSEYTTGVTHNSSTQVTIVVAASAPTLYYYCSSHSGMGGQVNTNSTLGSSNFDGTIQNTVKANATAGFSIVTWTGTGSAATIGHGLGVAPKWLVVKLRSGSQDWFVNNGMILNDLGKYYKLNSSGSSNASDTNVFPNTAPTSTVFSVGTDSAVNASGSTYIAYVFSEVEGYSKFTTYTGNGSTDGTFVYTGFTPTFMIQRKSSDENWHMMDTTRDPLNPNTLGIDPNLANAEANDSNLSIDFLSNGFKLRTSHATANGSGTKYILLAFAESPFKNARAR